MAASAPKTETDLLSDPHYTTVWDAKRQADLIVFLNGVSEAIVNQSAENASTSMSEDVHKSLQHAKLMDAAMAVSGYNARTNRFPDDFVTKMNRYLSSVAAMPGEGTWAPARPGAPSKDFAALAYVLHPDDPEYLREFIAARKGGRSDGRIKASASVHT